jgi:threonine synthase
MVAIFALFLSAQFMAFSLALPPPPRHSRLASRPAASYKCRAMNPIRYISTRGAQAPLSFKDAVMTGLARDGGLLIPDRIPNVADRLEDWKDLDYPDLAFEIIRLFTDDIPEPRLRELIAAAYATFTHPEVAPVRKVGRLHILELFHGPTLAFKDIALQFLGRLFEEILEERNARLNILAATSGDTGSAAICGVRGQDRASTSSSCTRMAASAPSRNGR